LFVFVGWGFVVFVFLVVYGIGQTEQVDATIWTMGESRRAGNVELRLGIGQTIQGREFSEIRGASVNLLCDGKKRKVPEKVAGAFGPADFHLFGKRPGG